MKFINPKPQLDGDDPKESRRVESHSNKFNLRLPSIHLDHSDSNVIFRVNISISSKAQGDRNQLNIEQLQASLYRKLWRVFEPMDSKRSTSVYERSRSHSHDEFQHLELLEPICTKYTIQKIPQSEESIRQFIRLAECNPKLSKQLQSTILSCGDEEVKSCIGFSKKRYEEIIETRNGSFLLQKLAQRSEEFAYFIERKLEEDFTRFIKGTYGCRLIQRLAEHDNKFLVKVIDLFCAKWYKLVKNTSSIFCMAACIKKAPKQCLTQVKRHLLRDTRKLTRSRHYKRLLVSYIDACGEEDLEDVFSQLRQERNFESFFEDKYLTYVSKSIARRKHAAFHHLLQIDGVLRDLLRTKYFRFFVLKLKSDPSTSFTYYFIVSHFRNLLLLQRKGSLFHHFSLMDLLFLSAVALTPLDNDSIAQINDIMAIASHAYSCYASQLSKQL